MRAVSPISGVSVGPRVISPAISRLPETYLASKVTRDHSTAMHSCQVIADKRKACRQMAYTIDDLISILSHPARVEDAA